MLSARGVLTVIVFGMLSAGVPAAQPDGVGADAVDQPEAPMEAHVGAPAGVKVRPVPASADLADRPTEFGGIGPYFWDYPAATRFCEPIRTAFADGASTLPRGGKNGIRQHPNGGYGVLMQIGSVSAYHMGADLGWFQDGEAVYAVANGIVRVSSPAVRAQMLAAGRRPPSAKAVMDFGNLILIEHRLDDGEYVMSLYGHLANDRRVRVGDIVTAGQQIGRIGTKSAIINGGYEPHLHFAIKEGRLIEPGFGLFGIRAGDIQAVAKFVRADEGDLITVEVTAEADVRGVGIRGPGDDMASEYRMSAIAANRYQMSSEVLWGMSPGEAGVGGYSNVMRGYHDPLAFLRSYGAANQPAETFAFTSAAKPTEVYCYGRMASDWSDVEWQAADSRRPLDAADAGGAWTVVFCTQSKCRASMELGWPVMHALVGKYANNPKVRFATVLTPLTSAARSIRSEVQDEIDRLPITIPVGIAGDGKKQTPFVKEHGVRGTPWVLILDDRRVVRFSNHVLPTEAMTGLIDKLLADAEEETAPPVDSRKPQAPRLSGNR